MNEMSERGSRFKRWLIVFVYATAMAWVESAVVYYLRTMIDRIEPYQQNPLPIIGALGPAELVREAATMVMLLTVGMLAGKTWKSRLGFIAMAFGVWDIFYYVFLKVMCGFPHSLTDWDILFLIPLPWWGPVWAPMSISVLMILWGTLATTREGRHQPAGTGSRLIELTELNRLVKTWGLNFLGVVLALYVFMADSLRVADQGVVALRNVLPKNFNWPAFLLALLLMSAPILQGMRKLRFELNEAPDGARIP